MPQTEQVTLPPVPACAEPNAAAAQRRAAGRAAQQRPNDAPDPLECRSGARNSADLPPSLLLRAAIYPMAEQVWGGEPPFRFAGSHGSGLLPGRALQSKVGR